MKRALISVSDKKGLVEFAQGLVAAGFEIISTGGTKTFLEDAGVATIAIDQVTNFPEMLDGRVKTLHPAIHGGLLARRDDAQHLAAIKEHQIELIDLVCVNLYPFKETIAKPDTTFAEAIENIDIGGPSMLRSAAKNHASVTVVVDPTDYAAILTELTAEGAVTATTNQRLAAKVFRHTAAYDALIADYLTKAVAEEDPEKVTITYERKQALRYGENSHQSATFYQSGLPEAFSVAAAKQLHGKELSYNNIKDTDAAIRIAREFNEPVAVAVKHMNPCGVGIGTTLEAAFDACYAADPVSIFGGIVVLNEAVTAEIAAKMHTIFLEIILAPSFTEEALAILTQKKNLRLLQLDLAQTSQNKKEYTSVLGGLLIQDQDILEENPENWTCVTKRQPTDEERQALAFAWKVCKHVKSNAIVLATTEQTVGIGAGQMNRVGSVKIACEQAGEKAKTAVLASDAFFPMNDSVELAAQNGIKAIIQPGGSIKDQDSIEMADQYDIAMLVTGVRHFRH